MKKEFNNIAIVVKPNLTNSKEFAEEITFFCAVNVIFLFAEKEAKEESIWDVLVASEVTVDVCGIPLYE